MPIMLMQLKEGVGDDGLGSGHKMIMHKIKIFIHLKYHLVTYHLRPGSEQMYEKICHTYPWVLNFAFTKLKYITHFLMDPN